MALGFFPSLHFNNLLHDWSKNPPNPAQKFKEDKLDLELFVYHPGYQWIGELILAQLDVKTVAKLRLVSKVFRLFVDGSRHWWVLHSRLLRNLRKVFLLKNPYPRLRVYFEFYCRDRKVRYLDSYPLNRKLFVFFETQARLHDLKFFVDCIDKYVAH